MDAPLRPPVLPASRRRPRRTLALAVVGAGVVGVLAANAVAGASGDGGYRTATVRRAGVDQTLRDVGTVEPVSQVSVAFPVAGTVATVDVAVGATVTTGQRLATLDGAALERKVDAAQAALDQAELTLEQARDGESGDDGGGSSAGDGGSARGASSAGGASLQLASATQSVDDAVAAAQDQVLAGQQEVDARLLAAQDALDSAQRICAAVGDAGAAPGGDPGSSTTSSSTTSTSPTSTSPTSTSPTSTSPTSTSPTTTGADPSGSIDACRTALTAVLSAQQSTADAQAALASAARTLDDLLAEVAADRAAEDQGSSGGSGSSSPSSADLIAHQKAVDAAQADLAVARQALEQATIVSPIDGTVTAVDLVVGAAVEAGSSTARILVEGPGGYEVTATLAVDQLPKVKLGQPATVVPDGSDRRLTGQVVAIGLAATSSSSGATTYPVTIALDDDAGLRNGSVASVAIVTSTADDALVVPTSAVRASAGAHSVIVLEDGKPAAKDVTIGAVGDTWTEVRSGLSAGQQVVLADLDQPLPSSATSSSNGAAGGGGRAELRFGPGGGGPVRFGRRG